MNKETTRLQAVSELKEIARNGRIDGLMDDILDAVHSYFDDALDAVECVEDLNGRDLSYIVDDCYSEFENIVFERICEGLRPHLPIA